MDFELDDRQRRLLEAGRGLGARCRGATPAQAGEDWRTVGAKELLRGAGVTGAALFLDAYAAARGSLRAARAHAEEAIAKAPEVLEAALLAGGLEGLLAEVLENVRLPPPHASTPRYAPGGGLPPELRPDGFPTERSPEVRRALADARTQALLARNLALRAAWVLDAGTPTAEVAAAPAEALAIAADAVVRCWPPLSPLLIGEEPYARIEAELFRPAAKKRSAALAAVATRLVGPPVKPAAAGPRGAA